MIVDKSLLDWLNMVGLFVNAIGAFLLIFFTSPGLDITETGENLIGWKNEPTPEQRAANLQKYTRHKCGFKAGVVLLAVGFIFQLVAALLR